MEWITLVSPGASRVKPEKKRGCAIFAQPLHTSDERLNLIVA